MAHVQQNLAFAPPAPAVDIGPEVAPTYSDIPVGASTFKGGATEPVHRWFRLTPSFGPSLVDHMLRQMGATERSLVLDPFSGAGTTPIQARRRHLRAASIEINPLLHFVSRVRAECRATPDEYSKALAGVVERATRDCTSNANTPVVELGIPLPTIHDVFRWWRPDVLRDLLLVRRAIDEADTTEELRDLLHLTLLGVLVPDLTNVSLGRLQLYFIDRSADSIDVLGTFKAQGRRVTDDLREARLADLPTARVVLGDSTLAGHDLGGRPTHVITSPPYPNRYSYVWNTRPHLYFSRMFVGKKEAADLDTRAIGGTWGSATSVIAKGEVKPRDSHVDEICTPVVSAIRAKDNLMANYVMKYWNLLSANVESVLTYSADDVKLAYVIGCSRVKGEYVDSDVMLSKLFAKYGLKEPRIERFRRRHSDTDLFESVVFARR